MTKRLLVAVLGLLFFSAPTTAAAMPFLAEGGETTQLNAIVTDNSVLSNNPAQSAYVAQLAAYTGYTGMRVDLIAQPDLSDPTRGVLSEPDALEAVCNAATGLVAAGVPNLVVNIRPEADSWPQTDDGRAALTDYAQAVLKQLKGLPTTMDGPIGCVAGKPLNILIQIGNEVNGPTFCRPQNDGDHKLCAEAYIREAAYAYPLLKAQAASYGTRVTIMGCNLADRHTPFGFNYAVKEVIKANRLKGPFWDICTFNPYPLLGSDDPLSGFSLIKQMKASTVRTYGQDGPYCFCEMAWRSNFTPDEWGYLGGSSAGTTFSELQVSAISTRALALTQSQQVWGFGVFLLIDQCSLANGWQSGQYYCNLTPSADNPARPKSSQPVFRQALRKATKPAL